MISETTLDDHMGWHLMQGEPGQELHHITILRAPAAAVGPLGLVDEAAVGGDVYAIAAVGGGVEALIADAAVKAAQEAADDGTVILFAVLSAELLVLRRPDDLGRALMAAGRLAEHPDAAEATAVYAACADGRRWRGRRYITGPDAGLIDPIAQIAGPPRRGEGRGMPGEASVRRLVGLR